MYSGMQSSGSISKCLILVAFFTTTTRALGIRADLRCTQFDGVKYAYTREAFSCYNTLPDPVCSTFFRAVPAPGPGNDNPRPVKCYLIPNLKEVAISQCAKTCGYCCLSAPPDPAPLPFPLPFPFPVPIAGHGPAPAPVPHPVPAPAPVPHPVPARAPAPHPIPATTPCTSYPPDTYYNCRNFKRQGFCDPNSHYTNVYKKKYCATTCKVC